MRLSESLRRGIMESAVGGLINRFKFRTGRRDTLFFEELLADYILECEKAGFGNEVRKMGEEWGFLSYSILVPETIKKIPPLFSFNIIFRKIWHNIGIIDDIHIEKEGNILRMIIKNEALTRIIGPNNLSFGFFMGSIEAAFNSSVAPLKVEQKKELCEYSFRLDGNNLSFKGRTREQYRKLNDIRPIEGYALKDALKRGIFVLDNNKIIYRKKTVVLIENTIFHIISRSNLLLEKMAETAHSFFKNIVKENADKKEKLSLLKTLFQIMGWGIIKILIKSNSVSIEIKNPPHGLLTSDNWSYLARIFLGYLWLIDKELKISNIREIENGVVISYLH